MPTIMVHHDIDDADHWLHASKREEIFSRLGVSGIRTFLNPQNPKQAGIIAEVPDLDAFLEMLGTAEASEAMKHDGVHADSLVLLLES